MVEDCCVFGCKMVINNVLVFIIYVWVCFYGCIFIFILIIEFVWFVDRGYK